MKNKKAHIIVISNEKGGTGKSTVSMNLAVILMYEGFNVATIDMDGRQATLKKYIKNRENFNKINKTNLQIPAHKTFSIDGNEKENINNISQEISKMAKEFDVIIIDTPGSKNYLFDEAHKYADTLITPISDSLIDLSVFADIDLKTKKIIKPSHYTEHIWDVKKYLAAQGKPFLNWIVVGNKLSPFNSKNKNIVFEYLEKLSKLYGFRLCWGMKDRTIYKEMFLEGLTVLDMKHEKMKMTISHMAAKREIRKLAEFISPKEDK